MLTVRNAENYLKHQMKNTKDVKQVWVEFKRFAQMPIEDEDDVEVLFQCGLKEDTFFCLEFVRQFTVYEGDEYSHMEQLHCEFTFEPMEELQDLQATEWYFETEEGIEEYFDNIESLEEFKATLNYTPLQLKIYQEEI
ncbi:hypothetical protein [Bacillus suaedaesalsae]|uniref:Uncharacterized protein n=1 Tax=Bacillus suaedaesalsae TaxID=2810349 RepID=A0ABS2DDJ8_9BACI|nr:hypothetical protein [Bacillus suaedaesalsae]MBM6616535.1 hypothetical protein [Bacillus suaedaesalsae]